MYPERYRMPLWTRLTSLAVVTALISGCVQKTMGYVTPTPEASKTPDAPYCDSHMLTYTPDLGLDEIDPNTLPVVSESLMGPSGVGRITGLNIVKNPSSETVQNVKQAAIDKDLDINVAKSTVVEFGMEGENGELCAPFTMILDEPKTDGTQKAYVAFGTAQIDANNDQVPDLDVLIPPFGGNVGNFLELGQVDTNPNDSLVHLGTVDQLDPQAISPLFSIDKNSGQVVFFPPFYQGGEESLPVTTSNDGASFINVSFKTTSGEVIVNTPTQTQPIEATQTPEVVVKEYNVCSAENYSECQIPSQDLFNGNYLNWLKTLPVDNFDPAKVNQLMCFGNTTEIIFAGDPKINNFSNPETSMVRRGITYAVTNLEPGEVGYDFPQQRSYLILPTYSFSASENRGVWSLFVARIDGKSQSQVKEFINLWTNSGNLLVVANQYAAGKVTDSLFNRNPLVVNTFKLYPDMQTRLDNFGATCDLGLISAPGIVLETSTTK